MHHVRHGCLGCLRLNVPSVLIGGWLSINNMAPDMGLRRVSPQDTVDDVEKTFQGRCHRLIFSVRAGRFVGLARPGR